MSLERYRPLVDEWPEFAAAAGTPEPVTLRVRTGRIRPEALRARLEAADFRVSTVEGQPDFLRVRDGPARASDTVEYWNGLYYLQRSVSGLAARALGPRPGERVLDLCAAPGGKTTHMLDLMGDAGCVVAVDRTGGRLRGLMGNLYRLAHTGAVVVEADGRRLPLGARFDRVLVDAPCSAEGTLRERGGELREQSPDFLGYVTKLQEALLRRAVALTRPGGVILYATCTFAPEENEAIVDRVLRDEPLEVEPIDLPLPHAPGVCRWEGSRYDSRLQHAWRVYPHHLDSGGLFMVRLRRSDGARSEAEAGASAAASDPAGRRSESGSDVEAGWAPVPLRHPADTGLDAEARATAAALEGRLVGVFGVPEERADALRWSVRGDATWVHSCAAWPLAAWGAEAEGEWRSVAVGLRAAGLDSLGRPRPSNDLLRLLGNAVTRRREELRAAEWRLLLRERALPRPGAGRGYVALALEGIVLGRGSARGDRIVPEVPGPRARRLLRVLEAGGADR